MSELPGKPTKWSYIAIHFKYNSNTFQNIKYISNIHQTLWKHSKYDHSFIPFKMHFIGAVMSGMGGCYVHRCFQCIVWSSRLLVYFIWKHSKYYHIFYIFRGASGVNFDNKPNFNMWRLTRILWELTWLRPRAQFLGSGLRQGSQRLSKALPFLPYFIIHSYFI